MCNLNSCVRTFAHVPDQGLEEPRQGPLAWTSFHRLRARSDRAMRSVRLAVPQQMQVGAQLPA